VCRRSQRRRRRRRSEYVNRSAWTLVGRQEVGRGLATVVVVVIAAILVHVVAAVVMLHASDITSA